jgi:glycosyltransferase involved in cell wall biosynthesis
MSANVDLRALILSTTPPIPRDYGNRNRIFQVSEFLKGLGYKISFLLYPFDEDWQNSIPDYYKALTEYLDYFMVVPNTRDLHRLAAGQHHEIDEWWDPSIGAALEWVFARTKFDLFIVNYTFFSRAFLFAPGGVIKVLETHDLFSGRREKFEAHGVPAEFFYTTPDQERIAFDRADLVVAIKSSEAKAMARMTSTKVISLPYWDSTAPAIRHRERPKQKRFDHDHPLRLGFIGAQNAVNIVNMNRFLAKFERWIRLYNAPVQIIVAGNVCRGLTDHPAFLHKLGRVERIEAFYDSVDAVLAPLEFSTGIKIKVGEALAWDKPVIGTQNSFDGYRVWHPTQSLPDVDAVCDQIIGLSMYETPWQDLVLDGRRAARSARSAQEHGFRQLKAWLRARTTRIILVTTRPLWRRETLVDEHLAHMSEYLSCIGKVVVLTTAPEPADASRIHAPVDFVSTTEDRLHDALRTLSDTSTVLALILESDTREGLETAVPAETCIWRLATDGHGEAGMASAASLIGVANAPTLAVSLLRYAPISAITELNNTGVLVLNALGTNAWAEAVAEYAAAAAAARGLIAETVLVAGEIEISQQAFAAIAKSAARRVILVGPQSGFEYVAQTARYRHQSCLLVSPDLVAPVMADGDGESLIEAIDHFLERDVSIIAPAGPDSGWNKVWAVLNEVSARIQGSRHESALSVRFEGTE